MALEITMPKLSDTMEEGTILKWRVQEGTRVSEGDIIAEVETDKAAMEMEAFEAGVVQELRVPEGETVRVGTVIAVLGNGAAREVPPPAPPEDRPEPTEKEAKPPAETKRAEDTVRQEDRGREKPEGGREGAERVTTAAEPPIPEPADAERKAARTEAKTVSTLRPQEIVASPAARLLAERKRIDLSRVRGTGPGGRIIVSDVEGTAAGAAAKAPVPGIRSGEPEKKKGERSTKIRRIVGRKMVESWQSIPHFFVTVAVDMTDIIRVRKSLGVSINDFIVTAAARSLRDFPHVNSHWVDDASVDQKDINIALAVATERGLYNPVIRNCGRLSLKEISRRATELVQRSHQGRLGAEELEGGTFTISNMGMLGVESFSAIITPPQAAVLAVGTVRGEAVVDEQGELGIAPIVRLTLSADHRILDGADAAEFLTGLKSYLEAPVTLIASDFDKEEP